MRNRAGSLWTAVLAGVATLAFAAPASAGTIRYTVPERADYTIQDNGNGIVKVLFNECVTAGERIGVTFELLARVTRQDGNATFSVLREEGQDPQVQFDVDDDPEFEDPPTIFLARGADNSATISISFALPMPNNGVNTFRIKLDPESGEGLGQGAGIMVRIPCVLQAPPAPPSGGGGDGGDGGGGDDTGGPQPGSPGYLTSPTEGVIPPASAPQARGRARCISVPRRLRARAGERLVLRVRVRAGSTNIQNALVRVQGPGFRQERRTGSDGVATFFVRPRRAGRIVIQSDVCFGAQRLRVAGRRQATAPVRPRFTG